MRHSILISILLAAISYTNSFGQCSESPGSYYIVGPSIIYMDETVEFHIQGPEGCPAPEGTWYMGGTTQVCQGSSCTLTFTIAGPDMLEFYAFDWSESVYINFQVVYGLGPPPPILLFPTDITETSFRINWGGTPLADDYELELSVNGDFSESMTFMLGGNITSYNITWLTPGTTYHFRLRAHYENHSQPSEWVGWAETTYQAIPIPLSAINGTCQSFTARWAGTAGALSYGLIIARDPELLDRVLAITLNSNSHQVTGLAPNTTYYYAVRAYGKDANSPYSNVITTTTLPLPEAPVALETVIQRYSKDIVGGQHIYAWEYTMYWTEVPGAQTYTLEYSHNSDFSNSTTKQVNGTEDYFEELTSPNGKFFYFRVRANNSSCAYPSEWSNTFELAPDLGAPIAEPATNIATTSFKANWWYDYGNVQRFELEVSSSLDFSSYDKYDVLPGTGVNFNRTVTGLSLQKSYYYRVRAIVADLPSNYSNIIEAINKDHNYIKAVTVQQAGIKTETDANAAATGVQSTTYAFFDGLGRPSQTVMMQQSPDQKDIVQPVNYDGYGREAVKYLPYKSMETSGWFKFDFVPKTNTGYNNASNPQYQFYQNTPKVAQDQQPYSETRFVPGALNRVVKQGAPGEIWQPDADDSYASQDHTVKHDYDFNGEGEVLQFRYTYPTSTTDAGIVYFAGTLGVPTYYPPNQLYKNKTRDEAGHEVIEYKDKQGRVILKRVQAAAETTVVDDENYASTYYIYDDFGNLVTVLPPEASKKMLDVIPHIYASVLKSGTFTRNNCGTGTGSPVTYTVDAGAYTSVISQADADQQAQNDVNANGQDHANTNGLCTFYNVQKSGTFTRNNCGTGVGSSVTYTVDANTYTSTVSQADADQQAQNAVNANGQAYANTQAPCTFYNVVKSGTYTRNNCGTGTGSSVIYTIDANTYTSTVSQAAADQQAQNAVNNNGQNYANTHGTCLFYNIQKSGTFTRNNCEYGGTTDYIVYANTHSSTISQADADQKAQNDVNNNGQAYANTHATCTYYNTQKTQEFYSENCPCGVDAGSITYVVYADTYNSTVSQADADQLALDDINANGQSFANDNGECFDTCTFDEYGLRIVNCQCENGEKIYADSDFNWMTGTWTCTYHYRFSDGSTTGDFYEDSTESCN